MKLQKSTSTHQRTPALEAAIAKYSNMPKHLLAPTQYKLYQPTFQTEGVLTFRPGQSVMNRVGTTSKSARAARYVASGILCCENLIDSMHLTQRDSDIEEVKELMMEYLGEGEAENFSIDTED